MYAENKKKHNPMIRIITVSDAVVLLCIATNMPVGWKKEEKVHEVAQ